MGGEDGNSTKLDGRTGRKATAEGGCKDNIRFNLKTGCEGITSFT
jgi:hypothetical protein